MLAGFSLLRRRALFGAAIAFASITQLGQEPLANAAPPVAALNKARAQFQQGLALETAGDWAGALGLLQEVAGVKMTPQVRFNIAVCEEHLGKLAAALGDYQLAQAEAQENNATDVANQVTGRIDALRARISKVVIQRGEGAEFATISLDGVALGASSIGGEMPVDPGPHTVEGRAPGFNIFMTSFNIGEKEVKTVNVTLPRATASGRAAPVDGVTASAGGEGEVGADGGGLGEGSDAKQPKKNILPFVVGGVGAASLVTSIVFFGLRAGAVSDLDEACGPAHDHCPSSAESTFNRGKTYSALADITLAVGVLGLGGGAVLYFTQPKKAKAAPAASVTWGVTASAPSAPMGMSLVGRF